MTAAVLFHQLPPVDIHQPDIALTILKGHLGAHRVPSQTIYWNLLLHRFYDQFRVFRPDIYDWLHRDQESRPTVFHVGPFLLELLHGDESPRSVGARASLLAYYSSLFPDVAVQNPGYLEDWLEDLRMDIMSFLAAELGKLDLAAISLWAVSCKFNQWIPGLVLTNMASQRRPDLPILIGGIASKEEAQTMMRVFPQAAYAIWGEGEEPLLALVRQLEGREIGLDSVPRLLYRREGQICTSLVEKADSGPLPRDDVSDYFAARAQLPRETSKPLVVGISLNTVRGCSWGRCRFCSLHQNLSLRHKEPDQIIEEIRDLATRYDVASIRFADADIHDPNLRRFDELLDRLVALRTEERIDVVYASDIGAVRLSATTLKKMALAGFEHLLAGFEAMTDRLLEKVNKSHRFAHNICFLKLTDKFKIQHEANIIMGVPDETREDIIESMQNLHYLRFYPPGAGGFLWIRPMFLGAGAPYETEMSDTERDRWVIDDASCAYSFLPGRIATAGDRMHLGCFRAPLLHSDLWDEFRVLTEAYQKTRREYHWFSRGEEAVLQERINREIVKELALEPEYCEVLRVANDRVVGFGELSRKINTSFPDLPEAKLREIVSDLKSEYLLYADEKLRTIISVVDTDGCPHPAVA